ncbi:hypothetical protein MUK42_35837 [Musa troglodytarum]|uniref:Uncharacterized protein n=1 Tax=Musa troglodytarum TaxID=320322 RepID=A0A9E7ECL5_9LILI|nr:hypothetical protein MUK42_35837 [Musa troglodytarum]
MPHLLGLNSLSTIQLNAIVFLSHPLLFSVPLCCYENL